jgi:hypothetical protein
VPETASPPAPDRARPTLAAAAAVALACALGWSHGFLHPVSLVLASLATAATVTALALGRRRAVPPAAPCDLRWATPILAVGVALSLAYDAVVAPGFFVPGDTLVAVRPPLAAMAVVVASFLWRRPPAALGPVRFAAVVALAAWMGALVIQRTPQPQIDVWYFQQMGASALLQGIDPYLVAYPNIYGPLTSSYAPAVLSPDRLYVLGNPYPPLTILLGLPAAALAADVRWVSLAAVLFSAWAIRRLGRGSVAAELAAVLLLVQPRMLFVLEQSWTEPTVLATALACLLLVDEWTRAEARGGRSAWGSWAAGLAGGIALTSKQYAPLVLLPVLFAVPARERWRAIAVAAGTAAAVLLPFILWDVPAFIRSVAEFQVAQPFRPDSLSWLSAAVQLGGPLLPIWPAFLLAGAALALGLRRAITLDQAALTAAGAWLVLVLFNKQAFCNYYWLAVGLLCAAVALCGARRTEPAPSDGVASA